MHKEGVAHVDCVAQNIMMDANPLYPDPWHPSKPTMRADWSAPAKPLSRSDHPVKYYFIDFGLSVQFDLSAGPPLAVPNEAGGEQVPPEFKGKGYNTKHNPFPTDVWYIGNFVREEFIQVGLCCCEPRNSKLLIVRSLALSEF
jgi:hypothetical protein